MTTTTTNLPVTHLLGLQLDQIAFFVKDDEGEQAVKEQWGLQGAEWIEDTVVAEGLVRGSDGLAIGTNKAKLLFNYDLGIELEILRYIEGPNYCDVLGLQNGQMCHVGMHTEKGAPLMDEGILAGMFPKSEVIQTVRTQKHTNQFLLDTGRKYRYTIFDSHPLLNCCLKVIERIEVPDAE